MDSKQKQMWNALQGNQYHEWVAGDLITASKVDKKPFFDSVMSVGFILIALVGFFNLFK